MNSLWGPEPAEYLFDGALGDLLPQDPAEWGHAFTGDTQADGLDLPELTRSETRSFTDDTEQQTLLSPPLFVDDSDPFVSWEVSTAPEVHNNLSNDLAEYARENSDFTGNLETTGHFDVPGLLPSLESEFSDCNSALEKKFTTVVVPALQPELDSTSSSIFSTCNTSGQFGFGFLNDKSLINNHVSPASFDMPPLSDQSIDTLRIVRSKPGSSVAASMALGSDLQSSMSAALQKRTMRFKHGGNGYTTESALPQLVLVEPEPEPFLGIPNTDFALSWTAKPKTPSCVSFAKQLEMHKMFDHIDEACDFAIDDIAHEPTPKKGRTSLLPPPTFNWSVPRVAPLVFDIPLVPHFTQPASLSLSPSDNDQTQDRETLSSNVSVVDESDFEPTAAPIATKKRKRQPPMTQYANVPKGDELLMLMGVWPTQSSGTQPSTLNTTRVVDIKDTYNMPDHSTLTKRVNQAIVAKWGEDVKLEFRRIQARMPKSQYSHVFAINKALAWKSLADDFGMHRARPFSSTLPKSKKELRAEVETIVPKVPKMTKVPKAVKSKL